MPEPFHRPPPFSPQALADLLSAIIVLVKGKSGEGKPIWAYACIKPSMAKEFREARQKGAFNLEEYGSILECGEGAEVPDDVAKRMERDFGVNHRFEEQLLAAIEASENKL